mmetsp:Transcript_28618/g.68891  ORF Transcript_28618/g.68891 Transcript_28618/m.68891 type:complete len:267 (+) Transcript_28618:99-899(+)
MPVNNKTYLGVDHSLHCIVQRSVATHLNLTQTLDPMQCQSAKTQSRVRPENQDAPCHSQVSRRSHRPPRPLRRTRRKRRLAAHPVRPRRPRCRTTRRRPRTPPTAARRAAQCSGERARPSSTRRFPARRHRCGTLSFRQARLPPPFLPEMAPCPAPCAVGRAGRSSRRTARTPPRPCRSGADPNLAPIPPSVSIAMIGSRSILHRRLRALYRSATGGIARLPGCDGATTVARSRGAGRCGRRGSTPRIAAWHRRRRGGEAGGGPPR